MLGSSTTALLSRSFSPPSMDNGEGNGIYARHRTRVKPYSALSERPN